MNPRRPVLLFICAAVLLAGGALLPGTSLLAEETTEAGIRSAPTWKLFDLDGREVNSEQFKGKVVVLDFWATWCQPCISEIPGYVELKKKYGAAGLAIVGVLYRDPKTPAFVKKFAADKGMDYTIVVGDDVVADAFGGLEGLPTTFLISRSGRILHQKVGTMPTEEYEKLVQQALK